MNQIIFSEIFYSIQGEGKLVGTPSVFFRTSYCNLRCQWGETRCDTPFTSWNPENKKISIGDSIERACSYDCKHLVITGGEPFIQSGVLRELCLGFVGTCIEHITIETNATFFEPIVVVDLISMSPKLSSSIPFDDKVWRRKHDKLRLDYDVIRSFMNCYNDYQVKFVIDNPEDVHEVKEVQKECDIPSNKIYLMPQGIESQKIHEKMEWIAELCLAYGYNLSPRLHIDIWGNRRGT